jgi:hypothetical protein
MKLITNLKLFIFPFSFLILFTGCEKDDGPTGNDRIVFDIGFATPDTRISTNDSFDSSWEDGDSIGVFAVSHVKGNPSALQPSGNYINNVKLIYSGGTWTTDPGADGLYFPNDGNVLDFYAYYPYDAAITDATNIAFNVMTNQTNSNYSKSDLLIATPVKDAAKGNAVKLKFYHALAMVQVIVTNNAPTLTITLRNVKTNTTLNLSTETVAAPTSESSITMYRWQNTGIFRALVPAQTVLSGISLFRFEQNSRVYASNPIDADLTLVKGQAETYTYTL